MLRSEVQDNWISPRIVRRLDLKTYAHSLEKNADLDGTPLMSAGKFVSLACSPDRSSKPAQHRFYVVPRGPCDVFDVLLGADILFSEKI